MDVQQRVLLLWFIRFSIALSLTIKSRLIVEFFGCSQTPITLTLTPAGAASIWKSWSNFPVFPVKAKLHHVVFGDCGTDVLVDARTSRTIILWSLVQLECHLTGGGEKRFTELYTFLQFYPSPLSCKWQLRHTSHHTHITPHTSPISWFMKGSGQGSVQDSNASE